MLRLGSAKSQDDWITPVTSLDQIYLHATIIQHVFRRKVYVKRIKNRLDPNLDPWSTAGYREVAIHLSLVCQEANNLGLEGHVCELLLIPKDMHDIKIGSRHRKYVTWRNLRGQ